MKQSGVVCQPGPTLLFFVFRFECLISGPKSYQDFQEIGQLQIGPHAFEYYCFKFTCQVIKQLYRLAWKTGQVVTVISRFIHSKKNQMSSWERNPECFT